MARSIVGVAARLRPGVVSTLGRQSDGAIGFRQIVGNTFCRLDNGNAAAREGLLLFLEWIEVGQLRQRRTVTGARRKANGYKRCQGRAAFPLGRT